MGPGKDSHRVPLRFAYSKDCCADKSTGTEVHIRSRVYLNLFKVSRAFFLPVVLTEKPFSLTYVNFCIPTAHKFLCPSI